MMAKIGPFFYIDQQLICHTCPLSEGRRQADKLDNSYGHEKLWDDHFDSGEYIDHPRGRVVWDCTNSRAIVYVDRCINQPEVLIKIKETFELQDYTVASDEHYCCINCVGELIRDKK